MGWLFPVLLFTHFISSTTAKSWEVEEDKFNSIFELYWHKLQHGSHKNLVQYAKFIKSYQVNNILRALLKEKLLLKCIAFIMYKITIKQMGINLGKLM